MLHQEEIKNYVPSGDYEVKVKKIEYTDNNLLILTYQIANGEFKGKEVFDVLTLDEFAIIRICKIMIACGLGETIRFTPQVLLGKIMQISFDWSNYDILEYQTV